MTYAETPGSAARPLRRATLSPATPSDGSDLAHGRRTGNDRGNYIAPQQTERATSALAARRLEEHHDNTSAGIRGGGQKSSRSNGESSTANIAGGRLRPSAVRTGSIELVFSNQAWASTQWGGAPPDLGRRPTVKRTTPTPTRPQRPPRKSGRHAATPAHRHDGPRALRRRGGATFTLSVLEPDTEASPG